MCVAAAIGGASLGSAVLGSSSARSASRAQTRAADGTIAEQRRQFDVTQQNMAPWMEAGRNALGRLQDPNAFQSDPGYNFIRSEGMRGIERSAAARGGAFSGNALRALSQFNNGLASQDFGNWWNRQAGLAGVGQAATTNLGQFGANASTNIGNAMMGAGEARASGVMGQANSITGGINSGLSNFLLQRGGFFDRPGTPPINGGPQSAESFVNTFYRP